MIFSPDLPISCALPTLRQRSRWTGSPIGDGPPLPRATRAVGILRETRRAGHVPIDHEPIVECRELFVPGRALVDVRLDEQLATGCKQAGDLVEESALYEKTLRVTLLPPRIGEVHEEATHRGVGLETGKREARVLGEDASAPAESTLREPSVHDRSPLAADFQTDESGPRLEGGALCEEPPPSRPELDLDPFASHDRADCNAIPGRQAGRVFVRTRQGEVYCVSSSPGWEADESEGAAARPSTETITRSGSKRRA